MRRWLVHVEGRQGHAATDDVIDTRTASQHRLQSGWAFEDYLRSMFAYQGGIADKLDGVAQPLLGMQQDRTGEPYGASSPVLSLCPGRLLRRSSTRQDFDAGRVDIASHIGD